MTCPVCNGPKSKRAQLCAGCRRAAITAGVNLLTAGPGAGPPAGVRSLPYRQPTIESKLSEGQLRAFHAKANHLDKIKGQRIGTSKKAALAAAGVEHTNDLTQSQASQLLDELEQRIGDAEAAE